MDVSHYGEKLVKDFPCLSFGECAPRADTIEQLPSPAVLHDDVIPFRVFKHLVYAYDVRVVEMFQNLRLTDQFLQLCRGNFLLAVDFHCADLAC